MTANAVTDRLVQHIVSVRADDLCAQTRDSARTFIQDSLGVALAGTRVARVATLKDIATRWGEGSAARIWGTGERVPAATAAFINGYQIHNQEWDCVHEPAVVHPMAVVLSTLIAFAESQRGIDGLRLMLACCVAVDVATTIGRAARNKLRFFRPAMCGALGATAGLAKLLELDRETTQSALGLTYSQLSGTMQAHLEGSPMLPIQIGINARASLFALDLARAGVQGPRDFLEGPFGYFTLIDPEWDPSAFDQLEQRSAICELSHKPYPSGRATHGGVDGVLQLRASWPFALEALKAVKVHAPPLIVQLVDRPARADMAPAYARLCLPYVVATALLEGDVGVEDFEPAAIARDDRQTLARKITVVRDDNPALNALAPQRVEISLHDGTHRELDLPAVLGAPGRPLSREQHLNKFRRAASAAIEPMTIEKIERLIALTDQLENLAEVGELVDALLLRGSA
jgi:2-methylcitrate dehydratase PrpD